MRIRPLILSCIVPAFLVFQGCGIDDPFGKPFATGINPGPALPPIPNVTDVDGNVYHGVRIGTQVWMVENLKVTRYNDNTAIPLVSDSASWVALTTAGRCWYNNDSTANANVYGALYNWATVNTGKLAPTGWHVPTDAEWTVLYNHLGGASGNVGSALKEAGTTHWSSSNTGTDNAGFKALPAGCRFPTGDFHNIGTGAEWWSSTLYASSDPLVRLIFSSDSALLTMAFDNNNALSVRCVRN